MIRYQGFTLFEALVALAILAIGLAASMRALGMASLSATELRNRQLAEWVAENQLAELRVLRVFPNPGLNEGDVVQGNTQFHWREEIKPTPNPMFRRVDIRVFSTGTENALAQLTSFVVQTQR